MATTVLSLTLLASPLQAKYSDTFFTEASCLATNIYFEARGESIKGQIAVALVTLNRVADADFPDTICEVVYQGKTNSKGKPIRNKCQFSWYCDSIPDTVPKNSVEAKLAVLIAITAMTTPIHDFTNGALYFHSKRTKVHKKSENIIQIGNHIFY
jgi:N-acetylmuramoyl-L-alanine amidase